MSQHTAHSYVKNNYEKLEVDNRETTVKGITLSDVLFICEDRFYYEI